MESLLTLLLLRFALIAGALFLLALAVFAIVLSLKRRDKLDGVRQKAAPVVRTAARATDNHDGRSGHNRPGNGRKLAGTALRSAARFLDEDPKDLPKPEDER